MKTELVRWSKPPRLVSAELVAAKDSISILDTAWVYSAPLAMLAALPWWFLSLLWISGPFTLKGWGITWFVINSIILTIAACVSFVRLMSPNSEPLSSSNNSAPLSFAGRRKLCQYDANRRRAMQRRDRITRYPETDFQYPHFSVWSEPITNGVTLTIIEHVPRRLLFIPLKYGVKLAAQRGRLATDWIEDPSLDELTEKFAEIELIAMKMEEERYHNVLSVHENRRNALMVRR